MRASLPALLCFCPTLLSPHTQKYSRNLVNPIQFWIVIAIFQYIQHQLEFQFVLHLSEKVNYIANLAWINKFPKIFLCAYSFISRQKKITGKTTPIIHAQLSERLAFFCIMGPSWNLPDHHSTIVLRCSRISQPLRQQV